MAAAALAARVRERANNRCEYCRMHQSLQGATFHVDYVMPASRGGASTLGNLAWCCPSCNLHKADRTRAADPESGRSVPLFDSRADDWHDHFAWAGYEVCGRTPSGRATVAALQLNAGRRLSVRRAEERFDLFPPP